MSRSHPPLKIFFSGSVKGGQQDVSIYHEIITYLNTHHGKVLSEFNGDKRIQQKFSSRGIQPPSIYTLCKQRLLSADVLVAEITVISMGVGVEIGIAHEHQIPIIALHRQNYGSVVSNMVGGGPSTTLIPYQQLSDLYPQLDSAFHLLFSKITQ